MEKIKSKLVIFLFSFLFSPMFFVFPAFANNPPDLGHSSFSASNQAPADGQSTINVTVTLQDSSGNPLSGDNVTFSDPSDSTAVFNPSSTTLNSSGQATFTITSTNVGTDTISVTDTSSNTPLNNLGQVTFISVTTPTPSPTPASCTDSAPGSTPQLTSAISNGVSQITLSWTDATDPVSYYLISYGVTSGQYIYGNPNVGGQGTTTYTVNSLAKGTTYYFVVKAVNGCNPGNFSNEVAATTTGGVIATTPTPISSDTTSQTDEQNVTPTDTPTDTPTPAPSQHVHPTVSPKPTFIEGISKIKFLEYAFVCILIFGILGGFIYFKHKKSAKKIDKTIEKTPISG